MPGLSKERRESLRRNVLKLRKIVEAAYAKKLKGMGFFAECSKKHVHEKSCYIKFQKPSEEQRTILEYIKREGRGFEDLSEAERIGKAILRYQKACAYTLINRLCALKALEVRGLFLETVTKRGKYGGLSQREYQIREKNPGIAPDKLIYEALILGFKEAKAEIPLLFEEKPYGHLYPSPYELREVISILNEEIKEDDWLSDDILGFIYQFYNEEERRVYRSGRGKGKRRAPEPDDIPIINQLYTPHWVVKVLTDNTLGRLLLEMDDSQKVRQFCSYLLPLPKTKREKRHPKEIKILDPACGSGHFLIYAFELLWQRWKEEKISPEEMANNILEYNLYGIDIDFRACQLAALGLYLKAKELIGVELRNMDLRKEEIDKRVKSFRPKAMNIVCADTRILDGNKKQKFLSQFEDPDLKEVVNRIVSELDYTYEYGSLLKVTQPLKEAIDARQKIVKGQERLFGEKQLSFKFKKVPKEITFKEIMEKIADFEKVAIEKQNVAEMLFSIDAKRSLGLLSLLMQKYDVILMNPAYGEVTAKAKAYLKRYYPKTHHDHYAVFIEQAIDLLKDNGYIGMLTNLTFMYLNSYRWLREKLLKDIAPPSLILEFGLGILDGAAVYTAGTVLKKDKRKKGEETIFIRLTEEKGDEKEKKFCEVLDAFLKGKPHLCLFRASLEDLEQVPGMPYAYWASPSLRGLFRKYPPLDRDVAKRMDKPKIADVKVGLQTGDDARFIRHWWEIDKSLFAKSREGTFQGKKWVPFAKGEEYARYYADISLVVNWERNGEKIKGLRDKAGKLLSRPQNESFYFREGVTWQNVNVIRFSRFIYLPNGTIFSATAMGTFVSKTEDIWFILGLLNSAVYNLLIILATGGDRHWHVGYVAPLPIKLKGNDRLPTLSQEAHDILQEWDTGNEISTIFIKPWLAQVAFGLDKDEGPNTGHPFCEQFSFKDWKILKKAREIKGNTDISLRELARLVLKKEDMLIEKLAEIQKEIDEKVYELYEIKEEDRKLIERELKRLKGEDEDEIPPEIRRLFPPLKTPKKVGEEERIKEHVRRLLSWYAKRVIVADPDGIVPLNKTFSDNLTDGILSLMEKEWGTERTMKLQDEIYEILGLTLEEWFRDKFFSYHISLYKNRPIFWLIGAYIKKRPVFSCFIYYHKLTDDTLPKVRKLYLAKAKYELQAKIEKKVNKYKKAEEKDEDQALSMLIKDIDQISGELEALKMFDEAIEVLTRPVDDKPSFISWFSEKVYEVRKNGYCPNIDYGILVNITPLKEVGILHKAAERVK